MYWLSTVMEQTTQNLMAYNNNHFIMFMTCGSDLQGLGRLFLLPPLGSFGAVWLVSGQVGSPR